MKRYGINLQEQKLAFLSLEALKINCAMYLGSLLGHHNDDLYRVR